MTIATSTGRVQYNGNGATVLFTVPFYFLDNTHLQVVVTSSAGVDSTKVLTTDYTVSGAGNPAGGSITMLAAPAIGEKLAIIRSIPITQTTDLVDNDPLPAEVLETSLDKAAMIDQQLAEKLDRALIMSAGTTVSGQLPDAATRADKLLAFDASGNPTVVVPPTGTAAALQVDLASTAAGKGAAMVGFLQAGTGAVARTVLSKLRDVVSVKDFGAVGDGVADDTAAIQAAIDYAALAVGGQQGRVVHFGTGTFLISSRITLPNRVGLQGANGRGTVIKPHSTFADAYMFHAVNGTSSMFGSYIRDMYIDARGKNMTAVVWSQAWQETCGMERVVIQFDGTTPTGFLYTNGYGGAAYLPLRDLEIFADSTAAAVRGIWVQQISLVGGFVLSVDGITIAGSASNFVDNGIDMVNDSLVCKGYHAELMDTMCVMSGVGSLSADTWTGSPSGPTVDMVTVGSTFTGRVSLRNMIPNGSTGQVFRDNLTGRNIPATGNGGGMLAEYTYQPSSFLATVGTQIDNVTGNGAEYIVVFNTEVHDYLAEYNNATGTFTALRTGKYMFSVCLSLNVPTGSTTGLIKLSTSNREYEIYRGSFDSQRDSGNNVTINGAMVADMDTGDTARITVTVLGLGANTVDVRTQSTFSGQWIAR